MLLKSRIKPSEISVDRPFGDSEWKNFEKEVVGRNIVCMCQRNGDKWISFTAEEYSQKCKHEVTPVELQILHSLTQRGYLDFQDSTYHITDKFIIAVLPFSLAASQAQ